MKTIIDDFFGPDIIASEHAMYDLIEQGNGSLDMIVDQFYGRSLSPQLEMQLGNLFGHFSNASVPKLITVIKNGNWGAMIMAPPCFSKLHREPAGAQLMHLVSSGKIDIQRLAIEAIGYLGNPEWSFELMDKVTKNHGYDWGKLSRYLFMAFFRITIKAKTHVEIRSSFSYIEKFYKLAGSEKFKGLWNDNWYSMEIIFSDFKPVAADIIMSDWLNHEESFFRELGLKALGWMRLNRAVKVIKQMALSGIESAKVIRECAGSLAIIDSIESAKALKAIYNATEETSDLHSDIALNMAMVLGRFTERGFIEHIYPELLLLGNETEAHTLYNLGLLGFDESIWMEGISSEDYIVRASIAPAYARRRGQAAIPKLLQMEREASHEIEKTLILSALMIAGDTSKKEEFLSAVYALHSNYSLRMVRITWKREIVFALRLVEAAHSKIWENMAGVEMTLLLGEIAELENNFKKPITQKTESVATPVSTVEMDKEIFISYSWGGESEKIVDTICDTLTKKKFRITRDKIALGYKGNIKKFMETIGQSRYVIVIISDKYLKSDNCMLEMLELKKRGELHERIFPIVLNDAKIYKESERLDYIIYWQKEIDQLNKKVRELSDISGTGHVVEKVNHYKDIRRFMDEITDLLRNMNTLGPDVHRDEDFSTLIDAII